MEAVASNLRKLNGWTLALAAVVVLGAALRLVWLRDMEYKADEAWTFTRTQEVGRGEPFPWLGMPSSVGIANPGLSCWIFVAVGRAFAVQEPTELARAVALLSIAAILVLIGFALTCVPSAEREPWLWAAALLAVNPLAVLFHRKIWPPSILPLFVSCLLIAWWRREQRWGACVWGLLGMCLGQIHLGGFFFAAGFAGWALLFERRRVAWRAWLLGSILGGLPLLPWLHYAITGWGSRPIQHHTLVHAFEAAFWRRWVTEPLGFGLDYTLEGDFQDFLRFPFWDGRPTYLVGLLHGLALVAGGMILFRAAWRGWRNRSHREKRDVGRHSPTAFTQNAALWGYGLALTGSGLPIHRHYLIITYPLEFLWIARLALGPSPDGRRVGRALLSVLCAVQILLSASFLSYVHVRQTIHGEYGVAYGAQKKE